MNDKTIDDRCADPVFYGLELAGDLLLKSRHYQNPDYWQQALVAMHATLVEMFLLDEYGFRYRSALEQQVMKDYLTAQLATFDPSKGEQRLPEPDDWFGVCPRCYERSGTRHDGADSWGYCLTHGVRWKISREHLQWWDAEVEDRSEANQRFQATFEAVEPWYGPESAQ